MPASHRNGDSRYCGATTVVSGQSSVYVNSKLWAVEGDQNSHGSGDLISTVGASVYINGKKVIVAPGDQALTDSLGHLPSSTYPSNGSDNVSAY